MERFRRRSAVLAAIVAVTLAASVGVAEAGAARLIMVYGELLTRPVVLTDRADNGAVIAGAAVDGRPEGLSARPYLNLALFWDPRWDTYVREGRPLDALRPEQADGHARFYPAAGEAPALVEFQNGGLQRLSPHGAGVLARHGIPTRVESAGSTDEVTWIPILGAIALVLACGVLFGARGRRRFGEAR